ncbi:MAG TPA: DUF4124 domain-containing protein [Geobacter sp.]|nr:DUF4124 domain-containing protein [Geobacter sp.]
MKACLLSLLLFFHLGATFAFASFYQWTDTGGVVHLTDDPDTIPKTYKHKAKRVDLPEPSKPAPGAASRPQPAPAPSATKAPTPGGHGERWWRQRASALRTELKTLQDARAQKENQLVKLKRERVIFQRARDREAINALQVKISEDESRIGTLLNQIQVLESEAAREGVPAEWLR